MCQKHHTGTVPAKEMCTHSVLSMGEALYQPCDMRTYEACYPS